MKDLGYKIGQVVGIFILICLAACFCGLAAAATFKLLFWLF